jgi:uncharacterized membrane protein
MWGCMKRRTVKLILLISGLAAAAAGLAILFLNMFSVFSSPPLDFRGLFFGNMMFPALIILAGIIPLIVVCLMHSKDVRETKRGLSGFLRFLAFFWIITGAINTAAIIMVSIFNG